MEVEAMPTQTDYGLVKTITLPFDEAVERTRSVLQDEGFGVLTEIDIKAKFKEKLDLEFKKYTILGACNPPLAHRAISAEPMIGLLLPCNVIVVEETPDKTLVAAIDPGSMTQIIPDNSTIAEVASDARDRLEKALRAL